MLRRLAPADADWLAELHADPAVMRYIDDGMPVPRAVVVAAMLPGFLREYAQYPGAAGHLAATDQATGAPLGWFGLQHPSSVGLEGEPAGSLEIGYRLFPAAWGRGYATEGARALVRLAFAGLAADQVVATTMAANLASRRVLEKAGLTLRRTFFAQWPEYLEGAEHGDVVYGISRQDWRGLAGG
jgi:RimJ/RimL family protein N-acetyltransferase